MQETALPPARLSGERARTSGQMRLFATLLRRGDVEGVRIDCALPQRSPCRAPDLRQYRTALGPVAVFGASNFPLAFSTAGGDTAAALAAGCPVVFKAHSGHMITAELSAQAIERARKRTGMPAGVFNMIFGNRVGADWYNIRRFRPWDSPAHCKVVERSSIWRRDALTPSRSSPKCRASTRS